MMEARTMSAWLGFSVVCSLITLHNGFLLESNNEDSFCPQLGCDFKGSFTQDSHVLPNNRSEKFVVWHSYSPSVVAMNNTNENYGCVGNNMVVVCPYHDNPNGHMRHIILNPETAEEYNSSSYATLTSIGAPIITKDGFVFAINGTHASLVDPIRGKSTILKLPNSVFPNGFLSPIYIKDTNTVVVVGNQSKKTLLFRVSSTYLAKEPVLALLSSFIVDSKVNPCPWLTVTEAAALNNRIFLYGLRTDNSAGVVALDISESPPYWKVAWELVDNSSSLSVDPPTCATIGDPSLDLAVQTIATLDNYLVVTLPIAVLSIKDNGNSGTANGTMIMFGGAHFLSVDNSLVRASAGGRPYVWSTAWPDETIYNGNLIGLDYTEGYNGLRFLTIDQYLKADNFDVTSRITIFPHPDIKTKSVMVFGARLNVTNPNSPLFTQYCKDCKVGVSAVVMGVVTSSSSTTKPDIMWMAKIPELAVNLVVRGQIIGINDKLIIYTTNGKTGYVMAVK